MSPRNIAASIRARLLAQAKARNADFNLLLTRYAVERILYRLSISKHKDSFVLKGALLFDVWFSDTHRPTRDADLLGLGNTETQHLKTLFADVCQIECDDGVVFDPSTILASRIRKNVGYAGVRVTLRGVLDGARCNVQIDVGFGDAVFPAPEGIEYPSLIDGLPQPRLQAYTRYTVVAEKFSALVQMGVQNSRLKDYYDMWALSMRTDFDGAVLARAIQATLTRVGASLPDGDPEGLSEDFFLNANKLQQWAGFLRKNALEQIPLQAVVEHLRGFLQPVVAAVARSEDFSLQWRAGRGWVV